MPYANEFFSPTKSKFGDKSFPGHASIPGHVGGSAPRGGGGTATGGGNYTADKAEIGITRSRRVSGGSLGESYTEKTTSITRTAASGGYQVTVAKVVSRPDRHIVKDISDNILSQHEKRQDAINSALQYANGLKEIKS